MKIVVRHTKYPKWRVSSFWKTKYVVIVKVWSFLKISLSLSLFSFKQISFFKISQISRNCPHDMTTVFFLFVALCFFVYEACHTTNTKETWSFVLHQCILHTCKDILIHHKNQTQKKGTTVHTGGEFLSSLTFPSNETVTKDSFNFVFRQHIEIEHVAININRSVVDLGARKLKIETFLFEKETGVEQLRGPVRRSTEFLGRIYSWFRFINNITANQLIPWEREIKRIDRSTL